MKRKARTAIATMTVRGKHIRGGGDRSYASIERMRVSNAGASRTMGTG